MSGRTEAEVTIDGVALSDAQVGTLRAAMSNFLMSLEGDHGLGPIARPYRARAREVEEMLVAGGNRPDRVAARRNLR